MGHDFELATIRITPWWLLGMTPNKPWVTTDHAEVSPGSSAWSGGARWMGTSKVMPRLNRLRGRLVLGPKNASWSLWSSIPHAFTYPQRMGATCLHALWVPHGDLPREKLRRFRVVRVATPAFARRLSLHQVPWWLSSSICARGPRSQLCSSCGQEEAA